MKSFCLLGLCLCVLGVAPVARASAKDSGFTRGNQLYAAGDFAKAAEAYEEQARRGPYTANLFYNLGDAYYRRGDRGRAILNYQRALVVEPGHAEALANLAFAGGKPVQENSAMLWISTAGPWFVAGLGWLAAAACLTAVFARRRRAFAFLTAAVALALATAGAFALWRWEDPARDPARAVITGENVTVRYEPADNAKVVTTLPAGAEVRLLSDQGAWAYAQTASGSRGWLASEKLERVTPRLRDR